MVDNAGGVELLSAILKGLNPKAEELGLCLMVWDSAGEPVGQPQGGSEFHRLLCRDDNRCFQQRYELVRYVLEKGESSRATNWLGCCLLGIPVFESRRLAGVLMLEYPTREMCDEEYLARLCDARELDRQVMAGYARQACRHSATEAPHLLKIFTQMLHEQQETRQTNEAVDSLSTNLASTYEGLSLLYRISGSMKVSQKPRAFLQDVCNQLLGVMPIEAAAAVVYDERTEMGEDIVVLSGDSSFTSQQLSLLSARHIVPRLKGERHILLDNKFTPSDGQNYGPIDNVLAVPLVIDQQDIGILLGINKQGDFDSFNAKLIESIGSQASVFLANNRMYAELRDMLMGVLYSLTEAIDAKDPYTCGHSRRVAAISRRLAEECDFEPHRVGHIYLSGLLHDVGKIGIPEDVLCKDGRLTEEEYDIIKRHPAVGAKILRRIRNLQPIIVGVLSHHERIDGRGYPDGLVGDDVPIEGRILGLADCLDAMTSHRTYRSALSIEQAIQEIQDCSGTQFDPHLVRIVLSWDLEDYMKQLHASNINDLHLIDEWVYSSTGSLSG